MQTKTRLLNFKHFKSLVFGLFLSKPEKEELFLPLFKTLGNSKGVSKV